KGAGNKHDSTSRPHSFSVTLPGKIERMCSQHRLGECILRRTGTAGLQHFERGADDHDAKSWRFPKPNARGTRQPNQSWMGVDGEGGRAQARTWAARRLVQGVA